MIDVSESDHKKFAYHEGARITRTVHSRAVMTNGALLGCM